MLLCYLYDIGSVHTKKESMPKPYPFTHMQVHVETTYKVSDIASEFNCHPDNVRLYKRELNKHFNDTDFDWCGYTKRISLNAYNMLKSYHFLIKDYGKSEAIKIIKNTLEAD